MNYYTYTHSTPEGVVFYVGKGSGRRAFSTNKRSIAWRNVVATHDGFAIKIIARFKTEDEAFDHEKQLIAQLRAQGVSLLNATDGGRGVEGYCQSEQLRAHKSRLLRGYRHETVTCPHCGFTGGATATKRWHFDNCKGQRRVKARTTVNGRRVFLGNYASKMEAQLAIQTFRANMTAPQPAL